MPCYDDYSTAQHFYKIYYFSSQTSVIPSWYVHIYAYLKDQIIPQYFDRNEKIRLKWIALKYIIIRDVLWESVRSWFH